MSAGDRYATPGAFRRALTDRLKAAAKGGRWTFQQLQRQVAYDRLIERLYLLDDGWIVKGATALLARDIGVRASLDVDLYREVAWEIAEVELRRAAVADIGDWFRFEIGGGIDIGNHSVRLSVNATIGATTWVEFHVDLVGSDLRMTGQPEDVPPLARGVIPGDPRGGTTGLPGLPVGRPHRRQGRGHVRAPRRGAPPLDSVPRSGGPGCHRDDRFGGRCLPARCVDLRVRSPGTDAADELRRTGPRSVGAGLSSRGSALAPRHGADARRGIGGRRPVHRSAPRWQRLGVVGARTATVELRGGLRHVVPAETVDGTRGEGVMCRSVGPST